MGTTTQDAGNEVRTAVFIDGAFYHRCSVFSRHRVGKGWLSVERVIDACNRYVAAMTGTPVSKMKTLHATFFDSCLPSPMYSDPTPRQRRQDYLLHRAGVAVVRYPARRVCRNTGDKVDWHLKQQGVDVGLATQMVHRAHRNEYDVAVLFAGDGDFTPAIRLLTELGKRVLVVYFQFTPWVGQEVHPGTYASSLLLDAATWTLDLTAVSGVTDGEEPAWIQRFAA